MTDPMTTPPLDLTALHPSLADAVARGDAAYGAGGDAEAVALAAAAPLLDRVQAAERDLAAVTVSRDGWQPRAEAAERAVAAVREVHKPVPVYTNEAGDCEHEGDCEAVELSDGAFCPDHTDGLTCNACAQTGEHMDGLPIYPCPTIKALDGGA